MNGASDSIPRFDPKGIPAAPVDPLYSLVTAYEADESNKKVDLGVGAYRDENAKPWILPVVRKVRNLMFHQGRDFTDTFQATEILNKDVNQDHEYIPIAGLPNFNSAAQSLILGEDSVAIKEKRVCAPRLHCLLESGPKKILLLGLLFPNNFRYWSCTSWWSSYIQIYSTTEPGRFYLVAVLAHS